MSTPKWDLKARTKALYLPALDSSKLEAQDPVKRNIKILTWGKCIRADGKTLFAIARTPFIGGSGGPDRRKAANRSWLHQPEAVKNYFIARSAQVIGGNLDALREVLDLYGELGGIGKKVQLPLPEEAMRKHQQQLKSTSAAIPVRDAQVPKSTTPQPVVKLPGVNPAGAKVAASKIERLSSAVPSMEAPSTESAIHTPVAQQHRYNLRSAGNPLTPSSTTPVSSTQQTRYNLRSGEKQKDSPQASLLLGTPCKSRPVESSPVDRVNGQSSGNVQYRADARLPLAPLLQPRASRMAALQEHASKSVTQQASSLSSQAKQVERSPIPLLPRPSHDFLTGSQTIPSTQSPQPLRPAKGRPSDDFDKSMSLAKRLDVFGMQPLNAEKLRSLRPAERDGYLLARHKITSKVLAGLAFLPTYASFPSELKKLETADEWREHLWREMTSSERDHFTQVIVELKQEVEGAASRLFQVIASELGVHIAFIAFYAGIEFPAPQFRRHRYESLDLEAIVADPSPATLQTLSDCFDGEDQDLFNFHLFPMICEGVDAIANDPDVCHLIDMLWQGLQWEEASSWKEGAWWLKAQLKRQDPMGLVKLLPCKPFGGSTDYHDMAQDLIMRWATGEIQLDEDAPDEDTELPSTDRSEQPSSTSLTSLPRAPEPSTLSTEEITNLMGKASILSQDDNLLSAKAGHGLESSIWAH
ncbi:unnamed protein product [Cercospora beticola]|nr:unnamed protein product [Cercospora beticola]